MLYRLYNAQVNPKPKNFLCLRAEMKRLLRCQGAGLCPSSWLRSCKFKVISGVNTPLQKKTQRHREGTGRHASLPCRIKPGVYWKGRADSWERRKVEAKHAHYVNSFFLRPPPSLRFPPTTQSGKAVVSEAFEESSAMIMWTDKGSLLKNPQPICRSLLIHKGLEAAGPCENTFDIENTQIFPLLFRGRRKENPPCSACCGEASPRRRRQAQTSRGWNNTSTWTASAARLHDKWTERLSSGWGVGGGGQKKALYLADGYCGAERELVLFAVCPQGYHSALKQIKREQKQQTGGLGWQEGKGSLTLTKSDICFGIHEHNNITLILHRNCCQIDPQKKKLTTKNLDIR